MRASSQDSLGRWFAVRYADREDVLARIIARAAERRSEAQQSELYSGMARVLANFAREREDMTPEQRARAAVYRSARAFLATRVPEPYRGRFAEAPPPGDTPDLTPPEGSGG
jgi:hypothetical protein